MNTEIYQGDCLEILKKIPSNTIDLVYLDPPFFTQKSQKLMTRDRKKVFEFQDSWSSKSEYQEFLTGRLYEIHRIIRLSGSIFFHCDRNAAHITRYALDAVFGEEMFRAEIIWHYRRWSNSQRNLLPAHQNIYFYTKTDDYKFNEIFLDYSPATNIEQILQKRSRDQYGKSVYAKDPDGHIILNGSKSGVPLSDVWDIPFLNPKAKERTGYPTQKPILLLERIVQLVTDRGDTVLDPFCGSGTTLVAAQLLGRHSIGIDISEEAVVLTRKRTQDIVKTESRLLEIGREAYIRADQEIFQHLEGIDYVQVQRNKGIDALLKIEFKGGPVPIKIQRPGETLSFAAKLLFEAGKTKKSQAMILIATQHELHLGFALSLPPEMIVIATTQKELKQAIDCLEDGYIPSPV